MEIKLYNTLSGKKETFTPLESGQVRMYDCGPTVYDYAHIGNLRSYVFADILRRTLEYNSRKVKQVINITDVGHLSTDADSGEDKMTKALKREGLSLTLEAMKNIGAKYTEAFIADLESLNIETPSALPKASEHIEEDIDLIGKLEAGGFAYKLSDGLYFDTSKFPSYGKLGGRDTSGQKSGDRIAVASEKKNPADFNLWKFDEKLGWQSPWGKGFPGWHIECSAMSKKYLGQPFDIHTGGVDHIPVHHNNEIAQSEAAYGVPLANYWLHNAFITVNDSKMAKSSGGFITLKTLLENSISPLAYRYWLLTAHYRSPVNFSFEAVKAAQNALIKLMSTLSTYPTGGKIVEDYREKFISLVNDDLDSPGAIALIWEMIKDTKLSEADKRATISDFDRVLGLKLDSIPDMGKGDLDIPEEITALAEAREEARKAEDWKKADALRHEIESRGFKIKDSTTGYKIVEV